MAKRSVLLTRADEMLLVCLLVLGDQAFSTTIQQEMYRRVRKRISAGTLWVALDQLAERGLVTKEARRNPDRKGGRPRVYYTLTAAGKKSLDKTRDLQKRLWKDVPTEGDS